MLFEQFIFSFLQPLEITIQLSVSVNLSIINATCRWNYTVFVFLYLANFI